MVAFFLYILVVIATCFNAGIYHAPVAKLTSVHTEITKKIGTNGKKELIYDQTITAQVLNGKWKGESLLIRHKTTESGVMTDRYHKGDHVFLSLDKAASNLKGQIRGTKRDVYLVALLGAMILLLIVISNKRGVFTLISVGINTVVYLVGFGAFMKGGDLLWICNIMAVLFVLGTLFILNGCNKKTLISGLSTFAVLIVIMGLFDILLSVTAPIDYSQLEYLEYLGRIGEPDQLFRSEILFAGLGAIMDVAVTITAALSEVKEKHSQVSFKELFQSGREVGYDIMGTMISVLFFAFACGLIPMMLISMNNRVSLLTMFKINLPTEIIRFLLESIGIVGAIPISIVIASFFLKMKKGGKQI